MNNKALEGADKEWGFRFGAEGTMSIEQVQGFLGVSERTVYRLIDDGVIRRGKIRGKPVICKKSVLAYLATTEA
jgi:excisionase family DNA binding protein